MNYEILIIALSLMLSAQSSIVSFRLSRQQKFLKEHLCLLASLMLIWLSLVTNKAWIHFSLLPIVFIIAFHFWGQMLASESEEGHIFTYKNFRTKSSLFLFACLLAILSNLINQERFSETFLIITAIILIKIYVAKCSTNFNREFSKNDKSNSTLNFFSLILIIEYSLTLEFNQYWLSIFAEMALLFTTVCWTLSLIPTNEYRIEQKNKHEDKPHSIESFSLDDYKPIIDEINKIVIEKKLFLQKRLTLHDVSKHTGFSMREVSRAINLYTHMNFNDYINQHRVQYVKMQIKKRPKHQNKTLLDYALNAGFNSKTSFNYVFKKFTGTTPSKYVGD